jgi:hypothetical protein
MVADMCNTVLVLILKPHGSVNTVSKERTAFPRNLYSIPGSGKAYFVIGSWRTRSVDTEVYSARVKAVGA